MTDINLDVAGRCVVGVDEVKREKGRSSVSLDNANVTTTVDDVKGC